MPNSASAAVPPDHVPAALVLPFNPWMNMGDRPHEALERVRPFGPIVFSPAHHIVGYAPRGSWMITRAKEARAVLLDTKHFSSKNTTGIPQLLGESFTLAPIEADPPEQAKTRSILNPIFAPKPMQALDGKIRQRAAGLIAGVVDRGHCDFVRDYAKILPAEIFLDLFGLPHEDLPESMKWVEKIMAGKTMEDRLSGLKSVADYLRRAIQERRARPRDDVMTTILHNQIDGRPVTDDEALGTSMLVYIAGLDTVVNSLSWQFRWLAENPVEQDRLRNNPSAIPQAVDELLRGFSIVSLTRVVTSDIEFAGVQMKQGDIVAVPTALASRDPDEFENPSQINLERKPRHLAFGFGPHMCLGMHLARVELIASQELWLSQVPTFRLKAGEEIPAHGGAVIGIERLVLAWD